MLPSSCVSRTGSERPWRGGKSASCSNGLEVRMRHLSSLSTLKIISFRRVVLSQALSRVGDGIFVVTFSLVMLQPGNAVRSAPQNAGSAVGPVVGGVVVAVSDGVAGIWVNAATFALAAVATVSIRDPAQSARGDGAYPAWAAGHRRPSSRAPGVRCRCRRARGHQADSRSCRFAGCRQARCR